MMLARCRRYSCSSCPCSSFVNPATSPSLLDYPERGKLPFDQSPWSGSASADIFDTEFYDYCCGGGYWYVTLMTVGLNFEPSMRASFRFSGRLRAILALSKTTKLDRRSGKISWLSSLSCLLAFLAACILTTVECGSTSSFLIRLSCWCLLGTSIAVSTGVVAPS